MSKELARNGMLETTWLYRGRRERQKGDFLFPPDMASLINLTDFSQLLESHELRANAEIDLDVRFPEIWGMVQKAIVPEELGAARDRVVELLMLYNFGSRLANEVLIRATHPKGERDFGEQYRNSRKDPKNFDHNDLHERGVDAVQLMTAIMVGAKHLTDETRLLAVAAPMISVFHDSMQLWVGDRQLRYPHDGMLGSVNPKDCHVEAAAAYVQILKPIIQQAGHLTDDLASRLVAVLSTAISVHDAPEYLKQNLLGDKKPANTYADAAGLFAAYRRGDVDRLTLTAANWLAILQQKIRSVYDEEFCRKHELHNIDVFIEEVLGTYGFGRQFEMYYTVEIERAIDDTTPPDWGMQPINRCETYVWNLLFTIADIHEMIAPGPQAVVRKERVHWSRGRPLALVDTDVEDALNPNSRDHHNQSDWCRQAAEWMEIAWLYAGSTFYGDPVFAEYVRNTYLRNMIQAQQLFVALAAGDEGLRWLDEMKRLRILAIAEKALRKSGTPPGQRQAIIDQLGKEGNIWNIRHFIDVFLSDRSDQRYARRFLAQFSRIDELHDVVEGNLREKPGPNCERGFSVHRYSEHEIGKLEHNFIRIWRKVCEIFGVTDQSTQDRLLQTLGEDRSIASITRDHPMIPAITSDSLGALSDARTVNPLPPEVKEKLLQSEG